MTFHLHPAAAAVRDRARACAADVVAPVAGDIDRTCRIPDAVRTAARAVVPVDADGDLVAWVVAVEELAVGSAATAVTAAGAALGGGETSGEAPQWPGLRGADADALRTALSGNAGWELAITAVLIGLGRAAVEHARGALVAARAAGTANDVAQPSFADAATIVDAARLLLWDAARPDDARGAAVAAARGMARLQALDAAALAVAAAERATDAEASRPGAALERIGRDASTVARVLGDAVPAHRAVAAAVLPV